MNLLLLCTFFFKLDVICTNQHLQLQVKAEFDADKPTINKLKQIEEQLVKIEKGLQYGKQNIKISAKLNHNERGFRSTKKALHTPATTTVKIQYPVTNGYFTNFILEMMNHFIVQDYDEAAMYAIVVKQNVNDNYINNTCLSMLGPTFVSSIKEVTDYVVSIPSKYLQDLIVYVYQYLWHRHSKLNTDSNALFNFIDSQFDDFDKKIMDGLIADVKNPRKQRKEVIGDIVEKVICQPFLRLPAYERNKLAKSLSKVFKKSTSNHNPMQTSNTGNEYKNDVKFDWSNLSQFLIKFLKSLR